MLAFTWPEFFQQITSGLASGAIFASLALALVLIYRATGVINFAQGEMATFTTYIAWMLMQHGLAYWPGFVLTLLIAFAGGVAVERVVIRPVESRPEIVIVIVTIGMLIAINGLTGWIWGAEVKAFDSPFPNRTVDVGGVSISLQDVGTFCVCLATVLVLWLFFRFTTLGLALRAAAVNPGASRLLGVRVGWMLAVGWGLAAVLGAVAGMMAAPTTFLDPNMMLVILIYAFAAAVLGGIDNPVGAVVGGLTLGVLVNLLGALRRLRGRGAAPSDGAGDPPHGARHPSAGALRARRRTESVMARVALIALRLLPLAVAVALVVLIGQRAGEFRFDQFTYVAIYFVALLGLNMLTGYNGQISLGHGAFIGIGAYVATVATLGRRGLELYGHHPPGWLPVGDGMRPLFTIPLAFVITGVVGFLFGIPALRLAGVSLALATFALAVSLPGHREEVRERHGWWRRREPAAAAHTLRLGHLGEAVAVLRGLGRGRDPVRARVAARARPCRSRLACDSRPGGGGDRIGGEPGGLQDARVRRLLRVRRCRRSAARDPGVIRQPRHVSASAVDPSARERRDRRARVAVRRPLRGAGLRISPHLCAGRRRSSTLGSARRRRPSCSAFF